MFTPTIVSVMPVFQFASVSEIVAGHPIKDEPPFVEKRTAGVALPLRKMKSAPLTPGVALIGPSVIQV